MEPRIAFKEGRACVFHELHQKFSEPRDSTQVAGSLSPDSLFFIRLVEYPFDKVPKCTLGSKHCMSLQSSLGWPACSICPACSFTTAKPKSAPDSLRPSRSWNGDHEPCNGCCLDHGRQPYRARRVPVYRLAHQKTCSCSGANRHPLASFHLREQFCSRPKLPP